MTEFDSCFAHDYSEARDKFVAAASAAGAELTAAAHPLRGPKGEHLSLDVARLGPAAATAYLCLGAGTHGIEGFCGSGALIALLRSDIFSRLPENVAVLLLHGINPHGFAWQRRVTEDNVDLNRNLRDMAQPFPDNPGYEEIYAALNPADIAVDTLARGRDLLRAYAKAQGPAALQYALTAGQTAHPEGLQYAGIAPTWSHRTLKEIFQTRLREARRIVLIDIHSGIGRCGEGVFICTEPETSPALARARRWWGDVRSTKGEGSVSSDVAGSITDFLCGLFPDREVTAVGLEFGTVAMNEVSEAMILDNWLHQRADPLGPDAPAIKRKIRAAFYVETPEWKRQIAERTGQVTAQGLAALAGTTA